MNTFHAVEVKSYIQGSNKDPWFVIQESNLKFHDQTLFKKLKNHE